MTLIVNLIGFGLIVLIIWWFWLSKPSRFDKPILKKKDGAT